MSQIITEESNRDLFQVLFGAYMANRKPREVQVGGVNYQAYDGGKKFVATGSTSGMPYYDSASMGAPNSSYLAEQGFRPETAESRYVVASDPGTPDPSRSQAVLSATVDSNGNLVVATVVPANPDAEGPVTVAFAGEQVVNAPTPLDTQEMVTPEVTQALPEITEEQAAQALATPRNARNKKAK